MVKMKMLEYDNHTNMDRFIGPKRRAQFKTYALSSVVLAAFYVRSHGCPIPLGILVQQSAMWSLLKYDFADAGKTSLPRLLGMLQNVLPADHIVSL